MRNIARWVIAGIVLALSAGVSQAKTTWDYYSFLPVSHPVAQLHKAFADEVTKRSNGELEMIFRPAGELPFSVAESMLAIGAGQVQMGHTAGDFMTGSAPLASVGSLPFLVRNWQELDKAAPIISAAANETLKKHGAMVLYLYYWPSYQLFGTGSPVVSVDDLKGRKIRGTAADQNAMLSRINASGVSIATAEVPVAMQRGVADGLITSAFNANASRWYEFLDWGYLADLNMAGPDYVLVNEKAFKALPASQQQLLRDLAKDWQPKFLALMRDNDEKAREALQKDHGMKLNTASAADVKHMVSLMQPYWDEWGKRNGAEGVKLISDLRRVLGK